MRLIGKKSFNLLGSIKIGLWSNGRRSCGLLSPNVLCSRVMAHQGKKRGRWSDAPIMPSAYYARLLGQCYDLGLLQLVRSRFSNIMCPKKEVSWLPEYTEWPGYSINGFFLPWWHGHIPRWQCQDISGSNCERVVQGAWDIIFTHGLVTTVSRPEPHWESCVVVLERALRSGPTLPPSMQDLGEKLMQYRVYTNLVTLQKLIKTIPQQISNKILQCDLFCWWWLFFFGHAVYFKTENLWKRSGEEVRLNSFCQGLNMHSLVSFYLQ